MTTSPKPVDATADAWHVLRNRTFDEIAIGDSATIAGMVGPKTKILIAGSGLVVPGFSDDHVHLTDGGAQLSFVELRDADTPAEFTRRIKAYAASKLRRFKTDRGDAELIAIYCQKECPALWSGRIAEDRNFFIGLWRFRFC